MKVLHLTDTHLGIRRRFLGSPPGWCRADDAHRAMELALEPALRQEVDLVVHSGDVFDRSSPPRRDVHRAGELLREVARRVPVILLAGNHDRRGIRRWLPQPGLQVFDAAERVVVAGIALAVVPFARQPEVWAQRARHAVGPGVDLLVAHQAFDGSRVPGLTFRVGRQRDTIGEQHLPRGVSHILCGHIHPRQRLVVGGAAVVHPGSTERTSWSEAGQSKGTALWELGRQVTVRFQDLPTRPMRQVRTAEDLELVRRGDLVRTSSDALLQAAIGRGGWCLPGRGAGPPAHPLARSTADSRVHLWQDAGVGEGRVLSLF